MSSRDVDEPVKSLEKMVNFSHITSLTNLVLSYLSIRDPKSFVSLMNSIEMRESHFFQHLTRKNGWKYILNLQVITKRVQIGTGPYPKVFKAAVSSLNYDLIFG